jgi:hypothetical protein
MLTFNSIVNHKTVVFDSVCSAWLVPFQVHTALFIPVGIAALILTYLYLTQKYRWASYVSWSMFAIELTWVVLYDYNTGPILCILLAVVALGVYTNLSCIGLKDSDLEGFRENAIYFKGFRENVISRVKKQRNEAFVRNFHIGVMYISLFNLALFCMYVESSCRKATQNLNQTHSLFRPIALMLAVSGTCILSALREADTTKNLKMHRIETDYRGTKNPWDFTLFE